MIYADYNATTALSEKSVLAMQMAETHWGNPSSSHQVGQRANQLLEEARLKVALAAGVSPMEVVFTSGGSEANTTALMGFFFSHMKEGFRVLSTTVEHSSVLDTLKMLEGLGASVRLMPVDSQGELDLSVLERELIDFKPHLVSIMAANNETGVVFPIVDISRLCRERGVPLHVDAVQAFGKLNASSWNGADLSALSAHKIQGPKGCGALVLRNKTKLIPTHFGGSQELKRRGGTQNMIGICGFAAASEDLPAEGELKHIRSLRDRFEEKIRESFPDVCIQGVGALRLANTSNLRFPGIRSEILLSSFDTDGLCVSAGSACSSGSVSPSHVLLALGLSLDEARESLRFSWSRNTKDAEIDSALEIVLKHVQRIRARRAHAGRSI